MAIDSSKFFDSIRIKPNKLSAKAQARANEEAAMCEWAGCQNKGPHRAPKGRENSREYWHFCLNHVREYNQSYNFFQGMNADAVARYQKDALTGHRPTWKMGANTSAKKGKSSVEADFEGAADPFHVFAELNGLGRLEIDDQLNFGDLLHREVGGLVALQDSPGIDAGPSIRFLDVAAVTHQAAGVGELAGLVNRGHRIAQRKFGEQLALGIKKSV